MPKEMPKRSRPKMVRSCAVALLLGMLATIVPASAQFPPTADDPQDNPPLAGTPKKKGAPAAAGPTVLGNWVGELTQVGSNTPYKFELSIKANGAETKYPDLDCIGKLNRIGQSKSYVFFVEIITKGQADKGGRCPDGTITVARQGDGLALGWFGSIQGNTVVAYGTLKKK
jgi:hypothetical protein